MTNFIEWAMNQNRFVRGMIFFIWCVLVAGVLSTLTIVLYDIGVGWYNWDTIWNWYGMTRDDTIVLNIVLDIIVSAIGTVWFDHKFKD